MLQTLNTCTPCLHSTLRVYDASGLGSLHKPKTLQQPTTTTVRSYLRVGAGHRVGIQNSLARLTNYRRPQTDRCHVSDVGCRFCRSRIFSFRFIDLSPLTDGVHCGLYYLYFSSVERCICTRYTCADGIRYSTALGNSTVYS